MTIKSEIKSYLEREPRARLRKNRYRAIANMLIEERGMPQTKESFISMLEDAESYNRLIRMVQMEHSELQDPTDNGHTKDVLEQGKQVELGYIPGFDESIKALNRL